MLRLTFFLASLLGGVNLYLADDIVLQILSGVLSYLHRDIDYLAGTVTSSPVTKFVV